MNFIKKIFLNKTKDNSTFNSIENNHAFISKNLDEQFVSKFINKGGHFFYPEHLKDLKVSLLKILSLTNNDKFFVLEKDYMTFLKKINIPFTTKLNETNILISGCEFLIADEAAIMTTSRNTKEYRHNELPQQRVVIAMTNQIVQSKNDALIIINNSYEKPPANIQTISIFAEPSDDLLGSHWYKTFLFLIEN
ncbi:MAG TPA: hypothetical protein ENK64_03895 [Flavobacteriales bacterium]|nr:hypothetical protein [Flavobacteriales bacterium]